MVKNLLKRIINRIFPKTCVECRGSGIKTKQGSEMDCPLCGGSKRIKRWY